MTARQGPLAPVSGEGVTRVTGPLARLSPQEPPLEPSLIHHHHSAAKKREVQKWVVVN